MARILTKRRAEQIAHVLNRQGIGRAGDDTTGAPHAVLKTGDLTARPALLPYRDAHVACLFAAPAVDALLGVHFLCCKSQHD